MAKFVARTATALSDLRFSLLQDTDVEFLNNINERFRGTVYEDLALLTGDDESGANFGGFGFSFNRNDQVTGGVVQAIQVENPGGSEKLFISDLNILATTIGRAVSTNGTRDDLAIWSSAFSGDDLFRMSDGADDMDGFGGDDTMFGNRGNDTLNGNAGKDVLFGGGGHDDLRGEGGRDALSGNGGDDFLNGGGAADVLNGGKGKDELTGGGGGDELSGGAGRDRLIGGRGDDRLEGGTGADTFVILDLSSKRDADRVLDFQTRRDVLEFQTGEASVDDLNFKSNSKGDAVVIYDGGRVILNGVSLDDLTVDNFDFDLG